MGEKIDGKEGGDYDAEGNPAPERNFLHHFTHRQFPSMTGPHRH
jgi:hypothetical protein